MHRIGGLLILICLSASAAVAQSPAGSNTLPIPWRQQVFSIPFQVTRPTGRPDSPTEVQLYLSLDQGKTWRLAQKVPPQQGKFTFRAHADGEYWFAMRTLGANGLFLDNQPLSPGLRVFVDTSAPVLQLQGQRGQSGEVALNWQVTDAGMDAKSLKLEYQSGSDEQWRPLSVTGMQQGPVPGSYVGKASFYGGQTGGDITVRAEVSDVAGNRTVSQAKIPADGSPSTKPNEVAGNQGNSVQQFANNPNVNGSVNQRAAPPVNPYTNMPNGNGANTQATGQTNTQNNYQSGTKNPFQQSPNNGQAQQNTGQSDPQGTYAQNPMQPGDTGHISQDNVFQEKPATAQPWPADKVARAPLEQSGPLAPGGERFYAQRNSNPTQNSQNLQPDRYAMRNDPRTPQQPGYQMVSQPRDEAEVYSPAPQFELPPGVKVRMVNSPAFELQYDVSSVGPSGVARVELWGTKDGGRTWALFGDDPDRESPVPAEVKFDGIYGFKIVVHAGSGKSSPLPQPGDTPEVWVGVDLTMPTGEILAAEPGENDINIRWTTSDAYPHAKPVTLSYSAAINGPWTQITSDQPAQGAYTWKPNREVPEAVFIQMQAVDEAGNVMTTINQQSVALPHHRPQGRIRDVQPIAPSASRGGAWFR